MTRVRWITSLGLLALLLAAGLLAAVPAARAQMSAAPSAGYSLTWYTVDGGGGTSAGGAYSLSGTAGQPDAGTLRGSTYTLAGGFWPSLARALSDIFLPLVRR